MKRSMPDIKDAAAGLCLRFLEVFADFLRLAFSVRCRQLVEAVNLSTGMLGEENMSGIRGGVRRNKQALETTCITYIRRSIKRHNKIRTRDYILSDLKNEIQLLKLSTKTNASLY